MATNLPHQYVVPWDKSDKLSSLSLAVNLDPLTGQPCIFQNLWIQLPYNGDGLKVQYTSDKEGVEISMPNTRTDYEYKAVQALLNLKCALYAYVSLLPAPGQTSKIGKFFMTMNQTHQEAGIVMSADIQSRIRDSITSLNQFSVDGNIKSWKGTGKIIQLFSATWTTVQYAQNFLKNHLNGVNQVSSDMIKLIQILFDNSHKIQDLSHQTPSFGGIPEPFWNGINHTSSEFVTKWVEAVASKLDNDTYDVMSSWQTCWAQISANYKDLTQYNMDDCINPNSDIAKRIAYGMRPATEEDYAYLGIAVSDLQNWLNLYNQTMAIMDQFLVDSRGRTHPVQAVLAQRIMSVQDYSIPSNLK